MTTESPALPFDVFCSSSHSGRPTQNIGLDAPRALNAAQTTLAVNAVNGNALVYDKQFAIADDGLTLELGMVWNSSDNQWRLDAGVATFDVASKSFIEPDGRVISDLSGDGRGNGVLTQIDSGYMRVFPDDGVREYYNADGKLEYKEYPNGQEIHYSYDSAGKLEKISLPSGRVVDVRGGIVLIDRDGAEQKICEYVMDASGSLTTKIRQPDGSDYVTSYLKNNDKLVITSGDETKQELKLDVNGKVLSLLEGERLWEIKQNKQENNLEVTQAGKLAISAGYDGSGHWRSLQTTHGEQSLSFICDVCGRFADKTHQDGSVDKYVYDSVTGLLEKQSNSKSSQVITRAYESDVTSVNYGVVNTETISDGNLAAKTAYQYTQHRQVEVKTSAEGRKSAYIYDKEKPFRLLERHQNGVVKYGYDQYGRCNSEEKIDSEVVLEKTTQVLDALGRVIETSTLGNHVVNKKYDGLDRLLELRENSRIKEIKYQGALAIERDASGLTTETVCDDSGLTSSVSEKSGFAVRQDVILRLSDGRVDKIEHADGRSTQYVYDDKSRLQKCITDGEAVCEYLYDSRDRMIGKKRYDTSAPERHLTSYAFLDEAGQLRFEVTVKPVKNLDGTFELKGVITEHRYQLGQRVMSIQSAEALTGDCLQHLDIEILKVHSELDESEHDRVSQFQYDLDGNLTREWVQTDADKTGFAREYQYDAAGNRTHELIYLEKSTYNADLEDCAALLKRHWYDAADRKVATLDPDNYLIWYKYDRDGHITSEIRYANPQLGIDRAAMNVVPPEVTDTDFVITREYDDFGREYKTINSMTRLEITREFDEFDHVVLETKKDLRDGKIRQTKKEYNAFGELIKEVSPRDITKFATRDYHPVTGLCLRSVDVLGRKSLYFYDATRKPILMVSPEGSVKRISYDVITGKPTELYQYATRMEEDVLLSLQDDLTRTGYVKDSPALILPEKSEKDRVVSHDYDVEGYLLQTIKENKGLEAIFYNVFNEVVLTRKQMDEDRHLENSFEHDLRGNVIKSVVDPKDKAYTTESEFVDPLCRMTKKTLSSGHALKTDYSGLRKQMHKDLKEEGRLKTVEQDAFLRTASETDWENKNKRLHEYDHKTGIHTVAGAVRASSEVKNAFGEIVETKIGKCVTLYGRDCEGYIEDKIYADGGVEHTERDIAGQVSLEKSVTGLETKFVERNLDGFAKKVIVKSVADELVSTHVPDVFGESVSDTDPTRLCTLNLTDVAAREHTMIRDESGLKLLEKQKFDYAGNLTALQEGDLDRPDMYREKYTRDVLGREELRRIDLGDGKFLTVSETLYDVNGKPFKVIDGNGRATTYLYDVRGNLRFTIDPDNNTVEKIYDANDREICEIRDGKFGNEITHKLYDADGLIAFEIRLLEKIEGADLAAVTEYRHDDAGNLVDTIRYAAAIDLQKVKISDVPALMQQSEFAKSPLNRVTSMVRDEMGRPRFEHGPDGSVTEFRYDLAGNEVARIINGERSLFNVYDQFGNLRFEIDASGYVKERRYNAAHVCTDKISYAVKLTDLNRDTDLTLSYMESVAVKIADKENDTHMIRVLDSAHRVIGDIDDADGEKYKSSFKLDPLDQCVEKTNKRGSVWIHKFDKLKNLVEETAPAVDVTVVAYNEAKSSLTPDSEPVAVKSKLEYDGMQNHTRSILAVNLADEARTAETGYDASHRISSTRLLGVIVDDSRDEPTKEGENYSKKTELTTRFVRDQSGRVIVSVDEQDIPEFTVYDLGGRKRFAIDGEGYVVEFRYSDAFSNPSNVIHYACQLDKDYLNEHRDGLDLADVRAKVAALDHSDDRALYYTYNHRGQTLTIKKDQAYTAIVSPDSDKKVDVQLFNREVQYEYNLHGELIAERRLRPSGRPPLLTRHFYDDNGNRILTISPAGYVTRYEYGMQNVREEDDRYLCVGKTEYFNAVSLPESASVDDFMDALVPDVVNDRHQTFKFDRRHLCVKETRSDGHPFFDTYLDTDRNLQSANPGYVSTLETSYDGEGLPVKFTNEYCESKYLIRNAVGDVAWELDYPLEVEVGVKHIPVKQYFYNAHRQRVGMRQYALPGNLEFDAKGNIKLENLVSLSDNDEITLTMMCKRGLPSISQTATGMLEFSTYDAMRRVIRRYHTASGFILDDAGKPVANKQLRAVRQRFNSRGDTLMNEIVDGGVIDLSFYQVNAFGERTAEGPAAGEYYLFNCYDKAGNRWFTNGDRATPTISYFDESDAEVVTYRSPKRDLRDFLSENGYELAKQALVDQDYQKTFSWLQRMVTYRDNDGHAVRQDSPWYREQPENAPREYDVVFSVVENPVGIPVGRYIAFSAPDEKFLSMEFKLKLKDEEKWTYHFINMIHDDKFDRDICYIDVSALPSDAYEFCLDFHYQEMDGKEDRFPSFRSEGLVMLDTGNNSLSQHPVWYMENDDTLVISGSNEGIYGVEILKDAEVVKRFGAEKSFDGRLKVDLSLVQSGEYSFRLVQDFSRPLEAFSYNMYRPAFKMTSVKSVSLIAGTLPPEMSNVKYEVVRATAPIMPETYKFPQGLAYRIFIRYVDEKNISHALGNILIVDEKRDTVSATQYLNPFIHISSTNENLPDSVEVSCQDGKVYISQVDRLTKSTGILKIPSGSNPVLSKLNPIILSSESTSDIVGMVGIESHENSGLMIAEEIVISNFSIDAYNFYHKRKYDQCWPFYEGLYYSWQASISGGHYLHVMHRGVNQDVVDISEIPLSLSHDHIYYQYLNIVESNFSPEKVSISVVINGDSVSLCYASMPLRVNTVPDYARMNYHYNPASDHVLCKYGKDHVHDRFAAVKFLQNSAYDDFHIMYFKNLPAGTDNVVFEYTYSTSLGEKVWRQAESHITSKGGLSVFTNNIPVGKYQCRFLPKISGKVIRDIGGRFKQDEDGYCYLTMNVRKKTQHLGQVFTNRKPPLELEVVRPYRLMSPDRWGNHRTITDRLGKTIINDFNMFNDVVKVTTPPVATTSREGVTGDPEALVTEKRYNTRRHKVEEIAPDKSSMKYKPNRLGQILFDQDADGVTSEHKFDLQNHCVESRRSSFGIITSSFVRENNLLKETRTYPNRSTEEIYYNEEMYVIKRKNRAGRAGNPDDYSYYQTDRDGRKRQSIRPKSLLTGKHAVTKQAFHPKSGEVQRSIDEDGRVQIWEPEIQASADGYVGIIGKHQDLSGQIIHYKRDFNKQILKEFCNLEEFMKNLKLNGNLRGITDTAGNPPPPHHIEHARDEAGRETDLIDNGANVVTRMHYDAEDYCKEYYFVGKNGRVYQATNTTYDALHRIHQICDTKIMIEFGYDECHRRRCAKVFAIGEDGTKTPLHRDSWYDYSPAGRVRLRDCILDAMQIKPKPGQGMQVDYPDKDECVKSETTIAKDGRKQVTEPQYGNDAVLRGVKKTTEGEAQVKTETRVPDSADRLVTRDVIDGDAHISETFSYDTDDGVLVHYTKTVKPDDKGDLRTTEVTRTVTEKSASGRVTKEEILTVADVGDMKLHIKDIVTTNYRFGDAASVDSVRVDRVSVEVTGHGSEDVDKHALAARIKPATLYKRFDANGEVIGIGPTEQTDPKILPEGYREFVVNSEHCYLLKETCEGRNYYFYAQRRPGDTTLVAYFGDLPDEVKGLAAKSGVYNPAFINTDVNHHAISANFPPPYPGKCTADGVKTYAEIAESMNYTGYAEAIAWANNADVNTVPASGTEIIIPTLKTEIAETAYNGSLPAIEMLLGSMYPSLAAPRIELKPPKVNWGLLAAEVAVGAAVTVATMGAAAPLVTGVLTGAVAGAIAGASASVAMQEVAMVAGQQHGFDFKAIGTQALVGGLTGGLSQAAGLFNEAGSASHAVSAQGFQMANLAKHIAVAEGVAVGQQGAQMALGSQKRPDWKGIGIAALNGAAGVGVSATFGDGVVGSGVYTGVTTSGDTLIRSGKINATTLSANMVGAMVGSYAGGQALQYAEARRQERREAAAAAAAAMPGRSRVGGESRVPAATPVGSRVREGAGYAGAGGPNMFSERYAESRGYGYAGNRAAFWSSRESLPKDAVALLVAKAEAVSAKGRVSVEDSMTPLEYGVLMAIDTAAMVDFGVGVVNLSTGLVKGGSRLFSLFEGSRAAARSLVRQAGWLETGGLAAETPEVLASKALDRVRVVQDEIPANSPDAAKALVRKYRALEGAQNGAIKTETLSDGRIRYYENEKLSRTPGPTRGASYVIEYNPNTGDVHAWMESYDHFGNVNRIHPKMYNGQSLNAPHYPLTLKDKLDSEYYVRYRR